MDEKDIHIIYKEIDHATKALHLDLSGLTILTEAASGIFVVSPLIALVGGAKKVYAISQTTPYGTFGDIAKNTLALAKNMKLDSSRLEIIPKNKFKSYEKINIVTNLGHVRPIDEKMLSFLNKEAVISYMCEAWEHRPEDLDLALCQKYNISVYGVNEEHPLVNCFCETGLIALKLILEAKISLFETKIAIISRDKFGKEVLKSIKPFNSKVVLFNDFRQNIEKHLCNLDLLIIADYQYPGEIIGSGGIIQPKTLQRQSPNVKIIQYCGHNNITDITKAGLSIYPEIEIPPTRMSRTLGDISYKAVIKIHTAGLKVGEMAFRKNFREQKFKSLIQPMK